MLLGRLGAEQKDSSVTTVTVQADKGWQDTGVSINAGSKVTIEYISGQWSGTGLPNEKPSDGAGDPSGWKCTNFLPANQCVEPIPDFTKGALVGKLGNVLLKVGNYLNFTATTAGSLLLRMNDGDTGLQGNSGSLVVRITVVR